MGVGSENSYATAGFYFSFPISGALSPSALVILPIFELQAE
jgi:hypothetical protein